MSERSGVARRGPGEHGASWAARVARRGGTLAALLLALALVPRAMPSVYAASTTAFQFTGAEQTFTVPAGVTTIHVIARGAPGGHGGYAGRAGGRGALVTGDLQVTPGQTLYVEVGGAATSASCVLAPNIPCHGGFNGGGTSYTGGGGGGASDVRTVSASQSGTLTSRLLVAAGGGGGADTSSCGGGAGGDGGFNGTAGGSCGLPGGAGGVAGAAGLGQGASTGESDAGAGGGGLHGGGVGGAGSDTDECDCSGGGGGGGGGSNLVPAGGTAAVDTTGTPEVIIELSTTTQLSSSADTAVYGQPVTFTAQVSTGGSASPTGTVTFEDGTISLGSGTLNNGVATFTTTSLGVGPHTLTAIYGGDASDTGSTSASLSQQISPAPLTITANNQSMTYGGTVPTFDASYSGLANGDTSSVVSGLVCGAVDGSGNPVSGSTPAGSYVITCAGANAANYSISYQPGTLTINQAAQTITFAALPNHLLTDAPFTVSASGGGSGNPVTFSAGPAGVCASSGANGATITLVGVGTCTVTANQAGSANYQAASPVAQSFSVASPPLSETLALASSPAGPVTTGSVVTASFSLSNHTTANQAISLKATLTYTGSKGSLRLSVPLSLQLNAGQTLSKSVSFPITKQFPRGSYTLSVTATDGSGDTASSSATLTVS